MAFDIAYPRPVGGILTLFRTVPPPTLADSVTRRRTKPDDGNHGLRKGQHLPSPVHCTAVPSTMENSAMLTRSSCRLALVYNGIQTALHPTLSCLLHGSTILHVEMPP